MINWWELRLDSLHIFVITIVPHNTCLSLSQGFPHRSTVTSQDIHNNFEITSWLI